MSVQDDEFRLYAQTISGFAQTISGQRGTIAQTISGGGQDCPNYQRRPRSELPKLSVAFYPNCPNYQQVAPPNCTNYQR